MESSLEKDLSSTLQEPGPGTTLNGGRGEVSVLNPSDGAAHISDHLLPDGGGESKEEGQEKPQAEKAQVVPFVRLFAFADTLDYVLMFFGTLSAIAVGVSQPAMTLLLGSTINAFGENGSSSVTHEVNKLVLKFIYIGLASGLAAYTEVSLWIATGERQSSRIRAAYLRAVIRQDVAFFDKETATGEVIARLSGDTLLIQGAIGDQVGKFIQFMATFLGGYVIAFIEGWKLALVSLVSLPLLVVAGALVGIFLQKHAKEGQDSYSEAAKIVEQVIGSMRTVVSFNGERKAVQDYDKALKKGYKVSRVQAFHNSWSFSTIFFVLYCTYALSFWYGGILVTKEGYRGGTALTVIFSTVMGGLALGQAAPAVNSFQLGQQAAFKMFEIIKRKPDIDSSSVHGETVLDLKGEIEFDKVHFCYPTRPGVQIFSDFCLSIPSHCTAALVGESGSGKSTVVSLIERFYDPQVGAILLDGVDIKTLNVTWLRQQIGLVGQEPVLFATSILRNIAYGKEGATMEEIQAAAELANAATFIGKLPLGYETQVGEHGTHLSGGQKQRVAIARAILKDPKILLLDEATSALDTRSERAVQEALDRLMKDRTTVVVAHRLSTIRHADMIAVVHQGKIIELGTHVNLLRNEGGTYAKLVHLQELSNVDEREEPGIDNDEVLSSGVIDRSHSTGSWRSNSSRKGSSKPDDRKTSKSQGLLASLWGGERDVGGDLETGEVRQRDSSILRLAGLLGKSGKLLGLFGCFTSVLYGLGTPVTAVVLAQVVSVYFNPDPHEVRKKANFWASMFLVLGVALALFGPAGRFCLSVMGHQLTRTVRRLMFDRIVRQDISWFDDAKNTSGAISARLAVDASLIQSIVAEALGILVQNSTTLVAAIVVGLLANWQLTLVVLAIMPLFGLQAVGQFNRTKGYAGRAQEQYEEASQMACDAVGSIRTVASFCAENKVVREYQAKIEVPKRNGINQGFVTGLGLGLAQLALFSAYALSFWYGSRLVRDGKTTYNKVFRVFLAVALSATTIASTMTLAPDLGKVKSAVRSIFGILNERSKIDPEIKEGKVLQSVEGTLELQDIVFTYPSRPEVTIFRKLSLVVPAGKTVAIVGESGSGKSTVIALLERFYDPDSGAILLDHVNIKELQIRWYRQQLALVSQEPVIFNDTVRANIQYGKQGNGPSASQEEVEAAAVTANAHKFISEMPDGYSTLVGERGIQLSGGQKQRVAIARAIMKRPPILLLDEATSALDSESERLVQEALDRVAVGRTTVVIAHRLSTIQNADLIVVVRNGCIAEQGRHDELIVKPNGAYAALANLGKAKAKADAS